MRFVIHGRPRHVSLEQLRAFLTASLMVLGYHKLDPRILPIMVRIRRKLDVAGRYHHAIGLMELRADLDPEEMLTVVLHETIHACARFPSGTEEKCVSTLTARMKPDVLRIADILLHGTYKRAAFLAHAKLSYVARAGDFYDPAQHKRIGVQTRYHRRRKAKR